MARVAFTLGIPIERFRVVDVVQVNARRRHRSLLAVSTVVDFSVLSALEADETAMAAIRASEVNITGPQALLDDPPPPAPPPPTYEEEIVTPVTFSPTAVGGTWAPTRAPAPTASPTTFSPTAISAQLLSAQTELVNLQTSLVRV
jgi:hypothetical protein